MKKSLLSFFAVLSFLGVAVAQDIAGLAPDQNPAFAVSRDKYMKMADSLNAWHSTTLQENYKAIDWLEERHEARASRREFRRQLRLERSMNYYGDYYYDGYRYPSYRNRNYYYYNDRYRYRNNRGFFINPWSWYYWWR